MKAKKSLGQNFLKSVLALNKSVEAGEVSQNDIILEIGPGKGTLTEKLLEKAGCVIAVEKDRNLFELLQNKFKKEIEENPTSHKATNGRGKLILINDDILNFQLEPSGLAPSAYKVIANIPYNITGAILKKFLGNNPPAGGQPERMILLVQNEVAKRIMARDGKESILSISVKAYGTPKTVMKVPARYFSPAPKVDSAAISIKNISRKIFTENKLNEGQFWQIVRAGFAHKRKKVSSNLKQYLKTLDGRQASVQSVQLGNKRAEELTLRDWVNLAKSIDPDSRF